jgi:hypothetical protein
MCVYVGEWVCGEEVCASGDSVIRKKRGERRKKERGEVE